VYKNTGVYFIKDGKEIQLCYTFSSSNHVFTVRTNMTLIFLHEKGVKELIGGATYENLVRLKDNGTSKVDFVQNIMSNAIISQKTKRSGGHGKEKRQKTEETKKIIGSTDRRIYIQDKERKKLLTLQNSSFTDLVGKICSTFKKEKIQSIMLNGADIENDEDVKQLKNDDTLVVVFVEKS